MLLNEYLSVDANIRALMPRPQAESNETLVFLILVCLVKLHIKKIFWDHLTDVGFMPNHVWVPW